MKDEKEKEDVSASLLVFTSHFFAMVFRIRLFFIRYSTVTVQRFCHPRREDLAKRFGAKK
jgi:hypothetical protein